MVPPFIFYNMKQLENIDLNAICRILEWVAVLFLILGIIGSFIIAQEEHGYKTVINMGIVTIGVVVSILDFLFLMFLSRIGDAVDDIRNTIVYTNSEDNNAENENAK